MQINDENQKTQDFSLHDCRAVGMNIKGRALTWTFPDGIWILGNSRYNPYGETLRTGRAQVCLNEFEIEEIDIFEELRLFHRWGITRRKSISQATLMDKLNSGRWELEFIKEYCAWNSRLYQCWVWLDRPPFHRECQIAVAFESIQYSWDGICEDRPW